MFKKMLCILLFGFLVIGAASATQDFKINDGFIDNGYYFENEQTGMAITMGDYDDEIIREEPFYSFYFFK